jgi:lipopolysaccharide/colanic/teichoic acid biosynthesis glycosyltransferase
MNRQRGLYLNGGKRLLDALLAAVAIVALSPVFCVVALAVWAAHGRPVLFRQVRSGLGERPFTILKFRTMTDLRDTRGRLLPDALRTTAVGRVLRSSSLDELPGLFNVLRGDMSLVGPRPLLVRYQSSYRQAERRRFDVRPGITGWAQVNGRNSLGWNERFARDLEYVDACSLALDVKIILRTIGIVLRREDVLDEPGLTPGALDDERHGESTAKTGTA